MKTIYLVDGDNNIGTGLKGIDMLSGQQFAAVGDRLTLRVLGMDCMLLI